MSENIKDIENIEETVEAVKETAEDEIAQTTEAVAAQAIASEAPSSPQKAAKPKKQKGMNIPYERRKALYGYGFILLWLLGSIYFFIMPVIESIIWSFCDAKPVPGVGGMDLKFIGIQNYKNALTVHPTYPTALPEVLGDTALKTPLILVFSIFIAIILNQKFKGRTLARAIFFLPVIIATGPVIDIINGNMDSAGTNGGSEQFNSLFETDLVGELLAYLGISNISEKLNEIINTLTSDIFNLVWNSGIQILLFLSALQTIPASAKEAAQMEGATSWEYFWKITLPNISPMIIASLVYTIVDSFVDPENPVMSIVLTMSDNWEFGYQSAMLWLYFGIVALALGIVIAIVNKFVYYEVG